MQLNGPTSLAVTSSAITGIKQLTPTTTSNSSNHSGSNGNINANNRSGNNMNINNVTSSDTNTYRSRTSRNSSGITTEKLHEHQYVVTTQPDILSNVPPASMAPVLNDTVTNSTLPNTSGHKTNVSTPTANNIPSGNVTDRNNFDTNQSALAPNRVPTTPSAPLVARHQNAFQQNPTSNPPTSQLPGATMKPMPQAFPAQPRLPVRQHVNLQHQQPQQPQQQRQLQNQPQQQPIQQLKTFPPDPTHPPMQQQLHQGLQPQTQHYQQHQQPQQQKQLLPPQLQQQQQQQQQQSNFQIHNTMTHNTTAASCQPPLKMTLLRGTSVTSNSSDIVNTNQRRLSSTDVGVNIDSNTRNNIHNTNNNSNIAISNNMNQSIISSTTNSVNTNCNININHNISNNKNKNFISANGDKCSTAGSKANNINGVIDDIIAASCSTSGTVSHMLPSHTASNAASTGPQPTTACVPNNDTISCSNIGKAGNKTNRSNNNTMYKKKNTTRPAARVTADNLLQQSQQLIRQQAAFTKTSTIKSPTSDNKHCPAAGNKTNFASSSSPNSLTSSVIDTVASCSSTSMYTCDPGNISGLGAPKLVSPLFTWTSGNECHTVSVASDSIDKDVIQCDSDTGTDVKPRSICNGIIDNPPTHTKNNTINNIVTNGCCNNNINTHLGAISLTMQSASLDGISAHNGSMATPQLHVSNTSMSNNMPNRLTNLTPNPTIRRFASNGTLEKGLVVYSGPHDSSGSTTGYTHNAISSSCSSYVTPLSTSMFKAPGNDSYIFSTSNEQPPPVNTPPMILASLPPRTSTTNSIHTAYHQSLSTSQTTRIQLAKFNNTNNSSNDNKPQINSTVTTNNSIIEANTSTTGQLSLSTTPGNVAIRVAGDSEGLPSRATMGDDILDSVVASLFSDTPTCDVDESGRETPMYTLNNINSVQQHSVTNHDTTACNNNQISSLCGTSSSRISGTIGSQAIYQESTHSSTEYKPPNSNNSLLISKVPNPSNTFGNRQCSNTNNWPDENCFSNSVNILNPGNIISHSNSAMVPSNNSGCNIDVSNTQNCSNVAQVGGLSFDVSPNTGSMDASFTSPQSQGLPQISPSLSGSSNSSCNIHGMSGNHYNTNNNGFNSINNNMSSTTNNFLNAPPVSTGFLIPSPCSGGNTISLPNSVHQSPNCSDISSPSPQSLHQPAFQPKPLPSQQLAPLTSTASQQSVQSKSTNAFPGPTISGCTPSSDVTSQTSHCENSDVSDEREAFSAVISPTDKCPGCDGCGSSYEGDAGSCAEASMSGPAAKKLKSRSSSSSSIPVVYKSAINKLDDIRVCDLKAECKKRNMPVSGPKPNLLERLKPFETTIVTDYRLLREKLKQMRQLHARYRSACSAHNCSCSTENGSSEECGHQKQQQQQQHTSHHGQDDEYTECCGELLSNCHHEPGVHCSGPELGQFEDADNKPDSEVSCSCCDSSSRNNTASIDNVVASVNSLFGTGPDVLGGNNDNKNKNSILNNNSNSCQRSTSRRTPQPMGRNLSAGPHDNSIPLQSVQPTLSHTVSNIPDPIPGNVHQSQCLNRVPCVSNSPTRRVSSCNTPLSMDCSKTEEQTVDNTCSDGTKKESVDTPITVATLNFHERLLQQQQTRIQELQKELLKSQDNIRKQQLALQKAKNTNISNEATTAGRPSMMNSEAISQMLSTFPGQVIPATSTSTSTSCFSFDGVSSEINKPDSFDESLKLDLSPPCPPLGPKPSPPYDISGPPTSGFNTEGFLFNSESTPAKSTAPLNSGNGNNNIVDTSNNTRNRNNLVANGDACNSYESPNNLSENIDFSNVIKKNKAPESRNTVANNTCSTGNIDCENNKSTSKLKSECNESVKCSGNPDTSSVEDFLVNLDTSPVEKMHVQMFLQQKMKSQQFQQQVAESDDLSRIQHRLREEFACQQSLYELVHLLEEEPRLARTVIQLLRKYQQEIIQRRDKLDKGDDGDDADDVEDGKFGSCDINCKQSPSSSPEIIAQISRPSDVTVGSSSNVSSTAIMSNVSPQNNFNSGGNFITVRSASEANANAKVASTITSTIATKIDYSSTNNIQLKEQSPYSFVDTIECSVPGCTECRSNAGYTTSTQERSSSIATSVSTNSTPVTIRPVVGGRRPSQPSTQRATNARNRPINVPSSPLKTKSGNLINIEEIFSSVLTYAAEATTGGVEYAENGLNCEDSDLFSASSPVTPAIGLGFGYSPVKPGNFVGKSYGGRNSGARIAGKTRNDSCKTDTNTKNITNTTGVITDHNQNGAGDDTSANMFSYNNNINKNKTYTDMNNKLNENNPNLNGNLQNEYRAETSEPISRSTCTCADCNEIASLGLNKTINTVTNNIKYDNTKSLQNKNSATTMPGTKNQKTNLDNTMNSNINDDNNNNSNNNNNNNNNNTSSSNPVNMNRTDCENDKIDYKTTSNNSNTNNNKNDTFSCNKHIHQDDCKDTSSSNEATVNKGNLKAAKSPGYRSCCKRNACCNQDSNVAQQLPKSRPRKRPADPGGPKPPRKRASRAKNQNSGPGTSRAKVCRGNPSTSSVGQTKAVVSPPPSSMLATEETMPGIVDPSVFSLSCDQESGLMHNSSFDDIMDMIQATDITADLGGMPTDNSMVGLPAYNCKTESYSTSETMSTEFPNSSLMNHIASSNDSNMLHGYGSCNMTGSQQSDAIATINQDFTGEHSFADSSTDYEHIEWLDLILPSPHSVTDSQSVLHSQQLHRPARPQDGSQSATNSVFAEDYKDFSCLKPSPKTEPWLISDSRTPTPAALRGSLTNNNHLINQSINHHHSQEANFMYSNSYSGGADPMLGPLGGDEDDSMVGKPGFDHGLGLVPSDSLVFTSSQHSANMLDEGGWLLRN